MKDLRGLKDLTMHDVEGHAARAIPLCEVASVAHEPRYNPADGSLLFFFSATYNPVGWREVGSGEVSRAKKMSILGPNQSRISPSILEYRILSKFLSADSRHLSACPPPWHMEPGIILPMVFYISFSVTASK